MTTSDDVNVSPPAAVAQVVPPDSAATSSGLASLGFILLMFVLPAVLLILLAWVRT